MKRTLILKVFIAAIFTISSFNLFAQEYSYTYSYNYDTDTKESISVRVREKGTHVNVNRLDYTLAYSGYFRLSDNDDDILTISPNGYFEVGRVSFGNKRKIVIKSDVNGKLSKKYFEGNTEGNYQKEGRQWLADILPDIVRRTGVGAEYRVESIYNRKGISGLLEEIEEIDSYSGAVRNLYFVVLIDNIKLSDSELAKVIPEIEMINSNSTKGTLIREILFKYDLSVSNTVKLLESTATLDYNTERASVLRVLNTKLKEDSRIIEMYFNIIEEMSINSEKGNVLKHLMQQKKLQNDTYLALFESLESFSSEREKGAILLSAINTMPINDYVIERFMESVEDLSSSHAVLTSEIMNKLIDYQSGRNTIVTGNKSIILQLLSTAIDYNSNSQKGLTLRKINNMFIADYEVIEKYEECLKSISNRIEQYNVILDLLEQQQLNKIGYKMVLDLADELVDDDYQHAAAAVLRAAIINMPNDDELIYLFFDVLEEMDQNSSIEEVLRTVNHTSTFEKNEQVVVKSIESLDQVSVDIMKSSVLKMVQAKVKTNEQKRAYNYVVKEIQSDYLKRKVSL